MVLTWMSATRNLAKKLMRALFQATLLASVRSKRRMSAIVFCPFKIHLVMNLLRITARWPFMHLQRSIFVLYLDAYFKNSGQIYPDTMVYTSNGLYTGIFEIDFLRQPRSDAAILSATGFTITTNYRIYEIHAKVNGTWATMS